MTTDKTRVLVLGGYGNFGKRISETLAGEPGIHLLIAGRNPDRAERLITQLQQAHQGLDAEAVRLDIQSPALREELQALAPGIVIHTSGPYQDQPYTVAQACITAGAHYIDLADDRDFVCNIGELDQAANAAGLLLVSGASSVPGLSSVVVDHWLAEFSQLESIDFAIAPGNQAERGEATVRSILSYTGHPFTQWRNGQWVNVYGWMDVRRFDFGEPVGTRWLANANIPDLQLFPQRYKGVKTVRFQAGLELGLLHNSLAMMGLVARKGIVADWSHYTKPVLAMSRWFESLGTDIGGMVILMQGTAPDGEHKTVHWNLAAKDNVGPYIPTLSAIILTQKLIDGSLETRGAVPCLGLYSLDEFTRWAERWGITQYVQID